MAEELNARGARVLVRSPWAPALLPIITFGIYHFVWYYKILAEMKSYGENVGDAQLQTISPVRGLLALFPGVFLLGIPTLISYIKTAQHVDRVQQISTGRGEGLVYLLFVFVPYVGQMIVEYMVQDRLNGSWRANAGAGGVAIPPVGAPTPAL